MWTAFVLALALFGIAWCVRRGEWVLPLAALVAFAIWVLSDRSQSPYVAAKALLILAPLIVLLAVRPLVEPDASASRQYRLAATALALVLAFKVADSSQQALRAANVAPRTHIEELRSLRPALDRRPTLFLGNDDFIESELAGVPALAPVIGIPRLLHNPAKPWMYGEAFDIDSLEAKTINEFDWVIATRDAADSEMPPQLRRVRQTRNYELWRRIGVVAPRGVLAEGGLAAAKLDCSTPAGRRIARAGGVARVRRAPIIVGYPAFAAGTSIGFDAALPPGAYDLALDYLSPQPIEARGRRPSQDAHGGQPGAPRPALADRPGDDRRGIGAARAGRHVRPPHAPDLARRGRARRAAVRDARRRGAHRPDPRGVRQARRLLRVGAAMSSAGVPLTDQGVRAIYREHLGRVPGDDEIALQLRGCRTSADLLAIVHASDEYALRMRRLGEPEVVERPRVNIWHPQLEAWCHPPGTVSADGIAIVGHEGWLFIKSGTNSTLVQHRGENPPSAAWLDAWVDALAVRRREADELGVDLACLVVPDKLAIYEDRFPEPIEPIGPRPALRLLERARDALLYPVEELRAARAGGEVALRTDTHLTVRGNRVLAAATMRALGLPPPGEPDLPLREQVASGDLGQHFAPRIVEVSSVLAGLGGAEVVADNRDEIEALGAHVGTRRVLRNPSAPDPRVAVLIGDSYGFPSPYYQGLGWWLAQSFAELHFLWVPFGWDPSLPARGRRRRRGRADRRALRRARAARSRRRPRARARDGRQRPPGRPRRLLPRGLSRDLRSGRRRVRASRG